MKPAPPDAPPGSPTDAPPDAPPDSPTDAPPDAPPDSPPDSPIASPIHRIGQHTVELYGQTFIFRLHGSFSLAEAKQYTALLDSLTAAGGPLFGILDLQNASGLDPQTRAWIGRWARQAQILGIAAVGASPVMRTVLTLLSNVTRLLSRRSRPMAFCVTEAEARAWVAAQRALLASACPSPELSPP
ncbi:MAG TPA: STAS/SEC14 domain-containing protein [Pseudomonadota bacterium]|nr:STAS/SEC14 domain-containing protein [Pseudomonadota bacterium]